MLKDAYAHAMSRLNACLTPRVLQELPTSSKVLAQTIRSPDAYGKCTTSAKMNFVTSITYNPTS